MEDEYLALLALAYDAIESRAGQDESDHRMTDCHKLATKIYLHAASLYSLSRGTRAPVPKPSGTYFFDVASANIIARVALDSYLQMYEVFFEPLSDDEREFRYLYWLRRGYAHRSFPVSDPESKAKLATGKEYAAAVLVQLEGTQKYASLTDKERDAVKDCSFRSHRGRRGCARAAGFGPETIVAMYDYYSSYVHADGFSVRQMMELSTPEKQARFMEACMHMVMMVLAKMIIEYSRKYSSAETCCRSKPDAYHLAEVWSGAAATLS